MKKIVVSITIIVVFLCTLVAYAATEVPQTVLDLRKSVVRVFSDYGDGVTGFGSGFVIGDGTTTHIITNNHVIEDDPQIISINYEGEELVEAEIVYTSEDYDLCILKPVDFMHQLQPFDLFTGDINSITGKVVYAMGYPYAADEMFDIQGASAQIVSITDGIISAVKKTYFNSNEVSIDALQTNTEISPGNSGGPLVLPNGQVVGVNTFTTIEDANINGAVAVSELIWILENNNIPYKNTSLMTMGNLIIICLAVLVVLAVVFILLIRKKKKCKTKTQSDIAAFRQSSFINIYQYLARKNNSFDDMVYILLPVMQALRAHENFGDNYLFDKNAIEVTPQGRGFLADDQSLGKKSNMWVYELGTLFFYGLSGKKVPNVLDRVSDDSYVENEISILDISANKKQLLSDMLNIDKKLRLESISAFLIALNINQIPLIQKAAFSSESLKESKRIKNKIPRKKKVVICVVSGVLFLFFALGAVHIVNIYNYTQAVNWIEYGDYKTAYKILRKVPQYVSSEAAKLGELAYAGTFYQDGNYKEAQRRFDLLGDFSTAKQMSEKSAIAIEQYEEYSNAVNLIKEGKYLDAFVAFSNIKQYAGSLDYMMYCYEKISEDAFNNENPLDAYNKIKKHKDLPGLDILVEELIPVIYDYGMKNLAKYDFTAIFSAQACFKEIKDYKDSNSKLSFVNSIIKTYDVFALVPYIHTYDAVKARAYDNNMMKRFLNGLWRGEGYYFEMETDAISYDLPDIYSDASYYSLLDGTISLDDVACFDFEIIDENTMNVHAYANSTTYRMRRQ